MAAPLVGGAMVVENIVNVADAGGGSGAFLGKNSSSADAASYTFSGVSFGDSLTNRRVFVVVFVQGATSLTSVSIDGTAGTIETTASNSTENFIVATVHRAFEGNTTGDIVVTPATSGSSCLIARYVVYPVAVAVEDELGSSNQTTTGPLSINNMACEAGGLVLAGCARSDDTTATTISWSGVDSVTLDVDESFGDSGNRAAVGRVETTETATTLDMTFSWGGASNNMCALVTSWGA